MTGLEVLGIVFSIILALGITMVIIWIIGSVWRNNRDIDELLMRMRYIEGGLVKDNSSTKTKRKTR